MKLKKYLTLPILLLLTLILYLLIHDIIGGTLLSSSPYNSYTLQALAWRSGRLDLGKDYPWLELAIYGGKYYVSFPPVPSLIMLPLTLFFGESTPDNLVILCYALGMLTAAYFTLRKSGASEMVSAFWSVFLILGSNLLWMCTDGSVWFLAQALNFLFCCLAILCAVYRNRTLSLLFAALAVGCRPFSVFLFPPLLFYFYEKKKEDCPEISIKANIHSQLLPLIAPVIVAILYVAFNYLRFHDPLEFGHSYLPEFNRGQSQFSFLNIGKNFLNILRPVTLDSSLRPVFPIYDGFLFFVANPFFIVFFTRLKKLKPYQICTLACMAANFICLLMHRTFGGWQFGARYTVDLLPYAFFLSLCTLKERPKFWEISLFSFAVLFNLYGAFAMHFLYQ